MSEASREDGVIEQQNAVRESLFRRAVTALSDVVMPPVCLVCRTRIETHDALCARCWRQIDFIRPPLCDRLGLPLPFDIGGPMISAAAAADPPPYHRARAVAAHTGSMQHLVHGLKFQDRHDVRRLLGRWLVDAGRELLPECDIVVPVPLARGRLLMRRFNQAAILANEVARLSGLRYEPMALERTRATTSQIGLTRGERQRNVAGAFAVPKRRAASSARTPRAADRRRHYHRLDGWRLCPRPETGRRGAGGTSLRWQSWPIGP